jgi:hypothetical protein
VSSISVSRESTAAPEALWRVVVGMDDWVDVVDAIEVVERLDDGDGFGLGTAWRETRTMFGKKATEDMEVTEYQEGVRYATAAESHGSKYFSEIRVDAADTGSRITMSFRGEPQRALTKVMDATIGRLFLGATRKALAKDLDDIAAAAEAGR